QNFSYCIFRERATLLDYFKRVRNELAAGGMFALDLYGGYEAIEEMEEERKIEGGFTYVWDQAEYLPGTGDYTCYIHFRFRDGTEMKRAFTYNWRYWNLPELKDVLREAGFSDVQSWFEQSDDEDGEGNGVYKRDETGRNCRNCAGWICYILALKGAGPRPAPIHLDAGAALQARAAGVATARARHRRASLLLQVVLEED